MSFDKKPLILAVVDNTTGLVASVQSTELLVSNLVADAGQLVVTGNLSATGAMSLQGIGGDGTNTIVRVSNTGALSAGLIYNADVASGAAIAYSKLALSNSIVDADVSSSAAISVSKLAAGSSGQLLMANATGVATYTAMSGDMTIDSTGNAQISPNTIVDADVSPSAAIAYSKLNLASSIVNADVSASAAIATSKLASGTSGQLLMANATGVATYTTMGGDLTIDSSGNAQIVANTIVNADISPSAAVAYSKLALTNSIVNADVASGAAIAYSKLALTNSIVNADVASGAAIAYSKLALTGSIVNADLSASAAISPSKLASGSAGQLLMANATGVASYTTLGGDLTIDGTGNAQIVANTIVNADVSPSANIAGSKVVPTFGAQAISGTSGITVQGTAQFLAGAFTVNGGANNVTIGGNVVGITGSGGITMGSNTTFASAAAVTVANLAGAAGVVHSSTAGLLSSSKVVEADVQAGTLTNASISSSAAIAYSKLALANSIVNGDVSPSAAIATSKLASGTAGYLLMANAAGVATYTQVSGDVTLAADGNVQLVANTIVNADVSPSANIAGTKIYPDFGAQNISTTGTFSNGTLTINGNSITGLTSSPASNDAAASKGYVDGVAQGLSVKDSVRALSSANITLSGTQTVGNVALVALDRVLVAGQTNAVTNGLYVVSAGSWSRTADAPAGERASGTFVFVEEGTYADTGWVCTSDNAFFGSSSLAFTQFSGAGSYSATNGVQLSGTTFSAKFDSAKGLQLSGTDLAVKLSATGALSVDANGIATVLEASSPSLQINGSNELGLKIDASGGLQKGASGTSLKLADSTLSLSGSGLQVDGLRSLFQINSVAVSANVTAANLSSLHDGGILSGLHYHDSSLNSFTTDDALSAGDPVYLKSNGNLGKAEASNSAKRGVIGIAKASASASATVSIVRDGSAGGLSAYSFTAGQAVYLGGSGGLQTTAPGAAVIRIGFAMASDRVLVDVHQIS